MIKFILAGSIILSSAQVFADKTDDYCKKLHDERGSFLDLVPPAVEDEKLTEFTKAGLEKKRTLEEVRKDAARKKIKMSGAEIAQYRRDFYNANCQAVIEAQKEYDKIPFEVRYCNSLAPIAEQADRYVTNPYNIKNNFSELHTLTSAVYKDITTEALDAKLSFEDYAKKVSLTSKAKGKEIVLGDYAKAQYTQAFYQKYCITEATALTRPKTTVSTGSNSKQSAELSLPTFTPIEASSSSSTGGTK